MLFLSLAAGFAVLLLCTAPSDASFRVYLAGHVQQAKGRVVGALTASSLWACQLAGCGFSVCNYRLFKLVRAPPLLLRLLGAGTQRKCLFLGLLNVWLPLCYPDSVWQLAEYDLAGCNYRGISLFKSRCLCLPSRFGARCEGSIRKFGALFCVSSKRLLFLNAVTWLELLAGLAILAELAFLLAGCRRSAWMATWSALADDCRLYCVFTHCLVHKGIFHTLYQVGVFYFYAPLVFEMVGAQAFIFFVGLLMLCGSLAGCLAMRFSRRRSSSDRFLGLSAVNAGLRAYYTCCCCSWNQSISLSIFKAYFSHALFEYLVIGDSIDRPGILAGLLAAIVSYKYTLLA